MIHAVEISALPRSSLIHITSARHKWHECDTSATQVKRVRHEWDTSSTSATQVQHDCQINHTSAIRGLHEHYELYMSNTSATQMKNFDWDNDTTKNIFSHLYIYYIPSERIQQEERFHSKKNLLEMPRFHTKMQNCYSQRTKYHWLKKYHRNIAQVMLIWMSKVGQNSTTIKK